VQATETFVSEQAEPERKRATRNNEQSNRNATYQTTRNVNAATKPNKRKRNVKGTNKQTERGKQRQRKST